MRKVLLFVVLMSTLILATTLPAAATPPSDVHFEVETVIDKPFDPVPFTASGPAVDDGLVCETGVVVDHRGQVAGFSPTGFNYLGIKHFTCDDGSGEFYLNLQGRIDYYRGVSFNWNVLAGTGDYEKLHGTGSGFGDPGLPCDDPDICVLDVYDGRLHID